MVTSKLRILAPETGKAIVQLPILVLYKSEQTEALRNVKGGTHGRLPHDFFLLLGVTLGAKQVHPECRAGTRIGQAKSSKGDSQGGIPDVLGWIDPGSVLESGVPHPTLFVVRLMQIDVQINPLILRGDL